MMTESASLVRQSRQTLRRSRRLSAWHASLSNRCQCSIATALERCETSFSLREAPGALQLHYVFYLRANIDDDPRLAIWRDQRLLVHPEWARRAEVLVGLGETFVAQDGRSIAAGLDNPLQAALTLVRAADRVLEFDIRLDEINMAYRSWGGS
jgi:hypothetical protein